MLQMLFNDLMVNVHCSILGNWLFKRKPETIRPLNHKIIALRWTLHFVHCELKHQFSAWHNQFANRKEHTEKSGLMLLHKRIMTAWNDSFPICEHSFLRKKESASDSLWMHRYTVIRITFWWTNEIKHELRHFRIPVKQSILLINCLAQRIVTRWCLVFSTLCLNVHRFKFTVRQASCVS